jgi:hypothetical protein
MDGGAVFIYLGVAFLILISPVNDSLAARVLIAVFWPIALVGVALSLVLRVFGGDY